MTFSARHGAGNGAEGAQIALVMRPLEIFGNDHHHPQRKCNDPAGSVNFLRPALGSVSDRFPRLQVH